MMKSPLDAGLSSAPGRSTDTHRNDTIIDGLGRYYFLPAALWIVTAVEALGALRNWPRMPLLFAALALVATIYGVLGLIKLRRKAQRLKLGRDGERQVAHILSTLNVSGARVFHDVPADGFNLDHVVVSTRGIFVVETKTWRKPIKGNPRITPSGGRILKAGLPAHGDAVGQVAAEARWLADLLRRKTGRSYRCQPVLVFPGWMVDPMDKETRDLAWVLNPKALVKFIEHEPAKLAAEDVCMAADSILVHMRQRLPAE